MNDEDLRAKVIETAKIWLGTPYQHQMSLRAAGCDCLGLLRGIWRALYGEEPERPPAYTPDWAELHGEETLYAAASRHMREIPLTDALPGDVLLFRMQPGAPAKHCAVLSRPDRIIHAYWGRAVTESFLIPYWQNRRAFAFRFPPILAPTIVSSLRDRP